MWVFGSSSGVVIFAILRFAAVTFVANCVSILIPVCILFLCVTFCFSPTSSMDQIVIV